MKLVVLGLSITSSWGNGHATTYRGLLREFALRGHTVHFLERDQSWYAGHRDYGSDEPVRVSLYSDRSELESVHADEIRAADAVIVGSYVPEGIAIGRWVVANAGGVTAFYDIDTPVTLARLRHGLDYLEPALIPQYQLYLSFTGGPTLERLEQEWGSPVARPLYCSADPALYFPESVTARWDLGYLGTYSRDRQPTLQRLLNDTAQRLPDARFVVAGPQYPQEIHWPANVQRREHLPPTEHRSFYNQQRFTLNVTRADMIAAGYSPSVRLFEAAACGTPLITDSWDGLEEFFRPGKEILVARDTDEVEAMLRDLPPTEVARIAEAARQRVLSAHTAAHRAEELERHLVEAGAVDDRKRRGRPAAALLS